MLSRKGSHVVLWEVTFHLLTHVRCDGALIFLEWKRGKRKERRGVTKRVMVKDGVAIWEEAVRFYGTAQGQPERGLKEKDLRLRVHRVRSSDEKRIGGTEIEIARFVHFNPKGEVEPCEQRVEIPLKLQEKGEKYTCTLSMTIRTQPPSGPVALHELESTASTNVSHVTTTELSDVDEDTSDPAPSRPTPFPAPVPQPVSPLSPLPDPLPDPLPPPPPRANTPARKPGPRTVTFPADLPPTADTPTLPRAAGPSPARARPFASPPPKTRRSNSLTAEPPDATEAANPLAPPSRSPIPAPPPTMETPDRDGAPDRSEETPPRAVSPFPKSNPEGRLQPHQQVALEQEVQEKDEEIRRLQEQLRRQKRENEHRLLVESAIMLITPRFISGLPVTSVLVFEALKHWRSFDPSDADSVAPFRTITSSFLALAVRPGGQAACYCLASTAVLFLLVQQEYPVVDFDREEANPVREGVTRQRQLARSPVARPAPLGIAAGAALSTAPALTFAEELQAVTVSIYKDLVMAARERLTKALIIETLFNVDFSLASNAISALKREQPIEAILQVLDDAVKQFEANFVPLELRAQFFTQLFLDITAVGLAALLEVPKLCTVGHGVVLKLKAAALERWAARCEQSGVKSFGKVPSLLREIANLLILTNKEQLLQVEMRRDVCPSLGDDLLARLLENYTPDEYDAVGFPYAKVRALKYRADAAGRPKGPKLDPAAVHPPTLWSAWLLRDFGRPVDGKSRWLALLTQDPKCIPKGLQDSPAFAFLYQ
eukprot:EG_transcript_3013